MWALLQGRGLPEQANDAINDAAGAAGSGAARGLEIAAQMAGDVVRAVVPDFVIERIPFLVVDVLEVVQGVV